MLLRRILFLERDNISNGRVARRKKVCATNTWGVDPVLLMFDEKYPEPNSDKILSFSGDPEEDGEDGGSDNSDPAVDLFAEASKHVDAEGEGEAAGDGADEGEPEDDLDTAWEVLDLARAIIEKQMNGTTECARHGCVLHNLQPPFLLLPYAETETFLFYL
jgi:hypothetical protein